MEAINLLKKYGDKGYIGEEVTQLEHAFQCAMLAEEHCDKIDIPIKTIRTVENINKLELYTGFGARYNMEKVNWMGLEGGVKNKKGNLFILGIGTDTENNLSIGGSIHWKLKSE